METGKIIYLKQLKEIFDTISEAVYVLDLETYEVLYINKYVLDLLNINETEYIGKKCYKLFQCKDEPCDFCINKNLTKNSTSLVCKNEKTNKWYKCISELILLGETNKFVKLGLAIDISNEIEKNKFLINKEKELKKKLDEKQVLIKEIHHRVKNNSQLLISLLHLQKMKTRSKQTKNVLNEIIERIEAISIMYDKLYNNKDLININISKYIKQVINGLSVTLLRPYNIKLETTIEKNVILNDISKITPIGLIINELLTNCVKHGFKNVQDTKKIKISLTKNDNIINLVIEDNGVGFPTDYNVKKRVKLGTILIQTLASQLNGKFFYIPVKMGTKASLEFKIK